MLFLPPCTRVFVICYRGQNACGIESSVSACSACLALRPPRPPPSSRSLRGVLAFFAFAPDLSPSPLVAPALPTGRGRPPVQQGHARLSALRTWRRFIRPAAPLMREMNTPHPPPNMTPLSLLVSVSVLVFSTGGHYPTRLPPYSPPRLGHIVTPLTPDAD